MPCFLLVTLSILDRAALLAVAKELGWNQIPGAVPDGLSFQTKQGQVTWDGTQLAGPPAALTGVKQYYSASLMEQRAKAKGYRVTRKRDSHSGDIQLMLLKQ